MAVMISVLSITSLLLTSYAACSGSPAVTVLAVVCRSRLAGTFPVAVPGRRHQVVAIVSFRRGVHGGGGSRDWREGAVARGHGTWTTPRLCRSPSCPGRSGSAVISVPMLGRIGIRVTVSVLVLVGDGDGDIHHTHFAAGLGLDGDHVGVVAMSASARCISKSGVATKVRIPLVLMSKSAASSPISDQLASSDIEPPEAA